MKDYLRAKECRRLKLMCHYEDQPQSVHPMHNCCDVCEKMCECGACPSSPLLDLGIVKENTGEDSDNESCDEMEFNNVADDHNHNRSSDDSSNDGDNDSDSDIEVYRRKPRIVIPELDQHDLD